MPMRMMLVCSFVPPFTAVVAAMTATMKFSPAFCVTSEKTAISVGVGASYHSRRCEIPYIYKL